MKHIASQTTVLLLALLALLAGCPGGTSPQAVPLWEADLGYLSRETFEHSSFCDDGVLVQSRDALQLLDPATGAVRWSRPTTLSVFPPGELAPLWIAVAGEPEVTALEELDPATGTARRRVTLARALPPGAALTWAGDRRVLVTGGPTVSVVDVERGTTLWEQTPGGNVQREQVFRDWLLVWDGTNHRALATSDGSERWRHAGRCCARASADGEALYLPGIEGHSVRFDAAGTDMEELDGDVVAIDRLHVAWLNNQRLEVKTHGGTAPVFTLPRTPGDAIDGVALHEGALFYFRGADDTLWRHDLAGGQTTAVLTLLPGGVVSPDGSGTVEPNLTVPPVWAPPYLFIEDRRLKAFRLPR